VVAFFFVTTFLLIAFFFGAVFLMAGFFFTATFFLATVFFAAGFFFARTFFAAILRAGAFFAGAFFFATVFFLLLVLFLAGINGLQADAKKRSWDASRRSRMTPNRYHEIASAAILQPGFLAAFCSGVQSRGCRAAPLQRPIGAITAV
jgi:ABC-type transport system involved in multi-copper enzyme maturation permease subunit